MAAMTFHTECAHTVTAGANVAAPPVPDL